MPCNLGAGGVFKQATGIELIPGACFVPAMLVPARTAVWYSSKLVKIPSTASTWRSLNASSKKAEVEGGG